MYIEQLLTIEKKIEQFTCPIYKDDTADDLAARIHELEHLHFPLIIEELLA